MLREQVQAIRASAAAQVAMADAILRALEGDRPAAPAGECRHPVESRTAVPRMGIPDAWLCQCGASGDS